MKLRPVRRHESGPTRAFPGRPAASAHQALLGFCGGPGRARQTSRGHAAGVRAGRTAITGGPLGQVLPPAGCCFMVWSPPWDGISAGWDFGNFSWGRRPGVSTTLRRGVSARCAGPDAATGRSFAVVSARLLPPIRRRLPRHGTAAAPAPPAGSGPFQSSGGRPPRWDRSGACTGPLAVSTSRSWGRLKAT